jgi:hypothetical protein
MPAFLRKLWPPFLALAVIVVGVIALPFAAALAVTALVCLVAIVRLKTRFWRNASLVAAAFLLGLAGVEFSLRLLEPSGQEVGAVRIQTPERWYPYDPVVQYRPKPGIVVQAHATWKDQQLYDVKYTILPSGDRAVPGSVQQGPTYLFFGDSYTFSEGVNDSETSASQFAQRLIPPAHVVNLGVPGWGATHMVRAMEAGLPDKYVVGKVAAVIIWVTPPHLERVTGESSWLGGAPRYDYGTDGKLHYTGTFNHYRWTHPLAGLFHLARTHLQIVRRLTNAAQERRQARLYVDLVARLQELVRERFDAPLILLSNGPEPSPPDQSDINLLPAFDGLRAIGAPVISVRKLIWRSGMPWESFFIPHDGHPRPLLNRIVADALVEYFAKAQRSN